MFGPKNPAVDVAALLIEGLKDGSISIDAGAAAQKSKANPNGLGQTLNTLRDEFKSDQKLLDELQRFEQHIYEIQSARLSERRAHPPD